jgi:hypothetical protein
MPDVIAFTPVDYDAETIPPDAPEGAWQAEASSKILATKKDKFPMIAVDWSLDAAYDDANESFVGRTRVSDFIVLFPEGHKASRMGKIRLRTFCDKLGISRSLIPKHIESSDDLTEFCAAIDGQKADIWTVHETQEDRETGEKVIRVKVLYKEPGGAAPGTATIPEVEEAEEEELEEEDDTGDPDEEPEDEEEEVIAAKPARKASPPAAPAKANGHAKTNGKAVQKKASRR